MSGDRSYVLARVPESVSRESFLTDYLYDYSYTMVTAAGSFDKTDQAYKIPNEWIVDGVNCSSSSTRQWNVLPASIDAGWTFCGESKDKVNHYFRSVRRKFDHVTDDGILKLRDTDNSSSDFNPACIPSVIEEQFSAVDVSGAKADCMTYDGVVKIQ